MKAHLLVLALPLLGFWVNILLGRRFLRDRAHWVAVAAVLGAWAAAMVLVKDVLQGQVLRGELYTWIVSDGFKVSIGFLVDELTAVMLVVVTTVSALVHIYSIGYMHGDGGYYRFFAYLNLFTFSMLLLVMADNFLLLYLGWEAVGLCSYLLIGYWFQKRSAADAGKKAFIVNRFGDFGFGLGVILIFLSFGTLEYAQVFSQAQGVLQGRTVELLGA
jgi:NADH-quinone oxidoreductase subunit L